MDYFRKYIGATQEGQTPSGAETVERLCERVQSSMLIDDRRDAVRALKSLSKKFRLEVGTQAMGILVHVLESDRADTEIVGYSLDTLCNLMSTEPLDEGDDSPPNLELASRFSEMFTSKAENISLLLSLLEEYDFHIRWPTVKLLTCLLNSHSREIQEIILASPMGVSKLMDLLSDSREIIRNDGLLLLIALTRGNNNIQKIVAFENAFERLLDIIDEEGNSDGGIVVEDCLLLMVNLLKNNSSNQNFFKEGSYVGRLPPYFDLSPPEKSQESGWSAQKVTNIHLMLQLVRTLVSPSNPPQQTLSCQKVMHQTGLLEKLCSILMASGVPADVLTETINTVSEVMRGNPSNQEYFASVMAPSSPPRPAIVVLLMSMVNDKQPFVLRCAVLYCFQSFLYKNELGQSQIVQTLLPSSSEMTSISAGQLLCGGLFSADSLSTWFSAVALLHAIVDNVSQKEQLLRVQLATSLGNPPVSLLQQCTNILAQGGKVQTRIGLLMILCHWLAYCPITVTHFLNNNANVPFLISQVSSSEGDEMEVVVQGLCAFLLGICVLFNDDQVTGNEKAHLRQIIEKRIGLDQFTDKLSQVSKNESYSRSALQPQLDCKQSSDVVFDHQFTRLFKKLETEVQKAVLPLQESEVEAEKKRKATLDQHESIVSQYKELIREQDQQLNAARKDLSETQSRLSETEKQLEEARQQVQQLKDQHALLKASRVSGLSTENSRQQTENTPDEENSKLRSSPSSVSGHEEQLRAEVETLKHRLEQQEEEVKLYKSKYEESTKQNAVKDSDNDSSANTALLTQINQLSDRVQEQEKDVAALQTDNADLLKENQQLQQQNETLLREKTSLEDKCTNLETNKSELEECKSTTDEELDNLKKEQEDLLVLLADQDAKIKQQKARLKTLGEQVTDDEEDFDDDEDEDGDEDLGDD